MQTMLVHHHHHNNNNFYYANNTRSLTQSRVTYEPTRKTKRARSRGRSQQVSRAAIARKASEERRMRALSISDVDERRERGILAIEEVKKDQDQKQGGAEHARGLVQTVDEKGIREQVVTRDPEKSRDDHDEEKKVRVDSRTRELDDASESDDHTPSLTDQLHDAYASDNLHLARILVLKLDGINVTSPADPRIDQVTDADFDRHFLPPGGLEIFSATAKANPPQQPELSKKAKAKQDDWEKAVGKLWEESGRVIREERQRWHKLKEQLQKERQEPSISASSSNFHTDISSKSQGIGEPVPNRRPRRHQQRMLLTQTPPYGITQRELVSYAHLSFDYRGHMDPSYSDVSAISGNRTKSEDKPERAFVYSYMDMSMARPKPSSVSSSSIPYSSMHRKSQVVSFQDVLTSMRGPLFPPEPGQSSSSHDGHHAYTSLSPPPILSAQHKRRRRQKLLANLLDVDSAEDDDGKGKARENLTGLNRSGCDRCRKSYLSGLSNTLPSPSPIVSPPSRSGSWFSFRSSPSSSSSSSSSSISPSSSLITTPTTSPCTSPLSLSPPNPPSTLSIAASRPSDYFGTTQSHEQYSPALFSGFSLRSWLRPHSVIAAGAGHGSGAAVDDSADKLARCACPRPLMRVAVSPRESPLSSGSGSGDTDDASRSQGVNTSRPSAAYKRSPNIPAQRPSIRSVLPHMLTAHLSQVGKVLQQFKQFQHAYVNTVVGTSMSMSMTDAVYGIGEEEDSRGYPPRNDDAKRMLEGLAGSTNRRGGGTGGNGKMKARRKRSGYRARREDVVKVFIDSPTCHRPRRTGSPSSSRSSVSDDLDELPDSSHAELVFSTGNDMDIDFGESESVVYIPLVTRHSTSTRSSSRPYSPTRTSPSANGHPPSSGYSPYAHSPEYVVPSSIISTGYTEYASATPTYLRPIANPVYLRLKAVQNIILQTKGFPSSPSASTSTSTTSYATTGRSPARTSVASGCTPEGRTGGTSVGTAGGLSMPQIAAALGIVRAGAMGSGRERVCGVGGGGRGRSLLSITEVVRYGRPVGCY